MLSINDDLLIGVGSERKCYSHPLEPDKCLKIPIKRDDPKSCPQCIVDLYCATRLKFRGVPMNHAAHCYGWVDTNMGPALLVEKIVNSDGRVALTLEQSLKSRYLNWDTVEIMLGSLRNWAMQYAVVISELNVKNLMVRENETGDHLVVIDGLGGRKPDFVFFLRQHIPYMARHKTRKRWPREFNKVKNASAQIINSFKKTEANLST